MERTDEDWRRLLTPEEFAVLRRAGTEAPFVGEYTDTETEGVYSCRACGAKLFRSTEKFHSHCGWPSFYAPLAGEAASLGRFQAGSLGTWFVARTGYTGEDGYEVMLPAGEAPGLWDRLLGAGARPARRFPCSSCPAAGWARSRTGSRPAWCWRSY